jgi:hypothetical protein
MRHLLLAAALASLLAGCSKNQDDIDASRQAATSGSLSTEDLAKMAKTPGCPVAIEGTWKHAPRDGEPKGFGWGTLTFDHGKLVSSPNPVGGGDAPLNTSYTCTTDLTDRRGALANLTLADNTTMSFLVYNNGNATISWLNNTMNYVR